MVLPITYVHLLLALVLLTVGCSKAASLDSGWPSHRAKSSENNPKNGDYVVDINATNFDQVFGDSPAATTFAVLEFSAHWCSLCRNYKPHCEKVAKLFNGPDAVHPGVVTLTRVDCALSINKNLCDKFSVVYYPTLFWGSPSGFMSGGWRRGDEKSVIRRIDGVVGRTSDGLLEWINEQLGSSYNLDDKRRAQETSIILHIYRILDQLKNLISKHFFE